MAPFDLANIDSSLASRLTGIGITHLEQLSALGSVACLQMLGATDEPDSAELLVVLEGAIRGIPAAQLDMHTRRQLLASLAAADDWVDQEVQLAAYDPLWPQIFAVEVPLLAAAIGPYITGGIHHIGSTAVPGLPAKPIIDIMVGVPDLDSALPCLALLGELSYCYAPYRPDLMHWFCKPDPAHRTHHLHLVQTDSEQFRDKLAFRDYLRSHPGTAAEYAELKRGLAGTHRFDREAYTAAKTDFVSKVSARARADI
mgnify:CR=1 FL=1